MFSASWQSVSFGLISQQACKPTGRTGKDQGAAKSLGTVAPSAFGRWRIEAPAHIGILGLTGNATQDTKKDQIKSHI